jgi:hypothetical protein
MKDTGRCDGEGEVAERARHRGRAEETVGLHESQPLDDLIVKRRPTLAKPGGRFPAADGQKGQRRHREGAGLNQDDTGRANESDEQAAKARSDDRTGCADELERGVAGEYLVL